MSNTQKAGAIYRTKDYARFRMLDGNRRIEAYRLNKVRGSIKENGYIMNPICVNERYEIIDGQARFTVLQELGLPVDYYQVTGLGVKDCIAMNTAMSNWRLVDYITAYEDMGVIDYKYLNNLFKAHKRLGVNTILNSIRQLKRTTAVGSDAVSLAEIKFGDFKCSQDEYIAARNMLEYTEKFRDTVEAVKGGRKEVYYLAIQFACRQQDVDKERLLQKITSRKLEPAHTLAQALDNLSAAYNERIAKGKKIYLSNDYQRFLDTK